MKKTAFTGFVAGLSLFAGGIDLSAQSKPLGSNIKTVTYHKSRKLTSTLSENFLDTSLGDMSLPQIQATLLSHMNDVRISHGLPKLSFCDNDVAQTHSLYLAETTKDRSLQYSDHFDANGASLVTRASRANIDVDTECRGVCRRTGENIATSNMTIRQIVQAWLDSPVHADNLLCSSFDAVAIGCAPNGNNIVADFFNVK